MLETETICSPNGSSGSGSGPPSLQNEFENLGTDAEKVQSPEEPSPAKQKTMGTSTTKKEQRSGNTLYQELSFQDNEESEENEVTGELGRLNSSVGRWVFLVNVFVLRCAECSYLTKGSLILNDLLCLAIIPGSWVHPGDYASSGMYFDIYGFCYSYEMTHSRNGMRPLFIY